MPNVGSGVKEIWVRTRGEHRVLHAGNLEDEIYVLHVFEKGLFRQRKRAKIKGHTNMRNVSEEQNLAEIDVSDKGIKARKALLTSTAVVWFVVLTGALPEQIGFASITFSPAEKTGMLVFLLLILSYFLLSFYFVSSPKWKQWKRVQASEWYQGAVRRENEYLRKEAPEKIRQLRTPIGKAVEGLPSPWDDSGKTEKYDQAVLAFVEQQEKQIER